MGVTEFVFTTVFAYAKQEYNMLRKIGGRSVYYWIIIIHYWIIIIIRININPININPSCSVIRRRIIRNRSHLAHVV